MCNYDEYNEEPIFYCQSCLSLDIRYDDSGLMYCHHCGAEPKDLDYTDIWHWMRLYAKKYKKSPLPYSTPYDDLEDVYGDDTESVATEADAYNSGMTVRDVMNLNLNRLDKI